VARRTVATHDPAVRLVVAAIASVAVILGLVAGWQPGLAVVGALSLAFVALMLSELYVGLSLFTVAIFFPVLGSGVSLAKLAGLLLALAWLVGVVLRRASDRQRPGLMEHRPGLVGVLALFIAWAALSQLWATQANLGRGAVFTLLMSATLFPIVFAALREPRHVRLIYAAFVVGALLTTTAGFLGGGESDPTEPGRLTGAGVNPNQLGGYLLVSAILAATLACSRELSTPARTGAAGAAGLCIVLQLLTGSRGAIVGLAMALVAAFFVAGQGRRAGMATAAVLVVLGGVAVFVTVAPPETVHRITRSDTTGSGRTDIWRVGWRMVEAHPLTGVGVGNFSVSTIDYLLRPGATKRAVYIVDEPKVAHNIYLEVLAELGLPGLVLFLVIVLISGHSAIVAARSFRWSGDREGELLARGLAVALAGLLAAAFFSSELFSKQLWLLLAIAVTLGSLAKPAQGSVRAA